jgi:PRC-barrel domain protein
MDPQRSDLRYIAANRVDSPAGRLDGTVVVSASKETLGRLDGIVFDPTDRRIRGFVVESSGWLMSRRYLVPPVQARLDRDHHALEVDLNEDEMSHLDEVNAQTFAPFSDDDLITALFHSRRGDA